MTPKLSPSNGRARGLLVGAGIVGTCCALWLQRQGFAVTMAGVEPSLDLSPFRIERFSAGQKLGKMALN